MTEGQSFYCTAVDGSWQVKREGGTRVIVSFASRDEALAYARSLIDRQAARFKFQDRLGNWQEI